MTDARKPFSFFEAGSMAELQNHTFNHPKISGGFPGKLFLKENLDLTSMEVSLNSMLPGAEMPFFHAHRESEELFICLRGTGEMILDDQSITLSEGSCVRIDPQVSRWWKNSGTEEFVFLVVQAKAGSFEHTFGSDGIPASRK